MRLAASNLKTLTLTPTLALSRSLALTLTLSLTLTLTLTLAPLLTRCGYMLVIPLSCWLNGLAQPPGRAWVHTLSP